MFIIPAKTATSFVISLAAILSKLTIVLVALTDYQNLVLEILGLNADIHITMLVVETIWVHK